MSSNRVYQMDPNNLSHKTNVNENILESVIVV